MKTTLTIKQQQVLGGLSISKSSLSYKSLIECLEYGSSRTGKSSYSGGYANKSIWTSSVSDLLTKLGITHECCNDAPRGGANGEFVKITDTRFLNRIKKYTAFKANEARMTAEEAAKAQAESRDKAIELINSLPANEAFEAKWNSVELKNASNLSWSDYRQHLKTSFPNEWAILKAKFQAKQSII